MPIQRRRLTTRRLGAGLERLETRIALAALPAGFEEVPLATGLSRPTAMAIAPDGRVFITEQAGDLRVVKNGALLPNEFVSIPVNSDGERGLLGVAFDPNFNANQFVYVYYTTNTGPVHNRVSRFTASGDAAVPGSEVVLLDLDNLSNATNHNGGALHFGPDGKLYVAVGENATPSNSQTLANLHGKILRIDATPGDIVPSDNPFVGTPGARGEIWALGFRNPFTFSVQPGTGRMFVNDVGAGTWEEINDLTKGGNYGWPGAEGPSTDPNFISPIFAYRHDSGAPVGQAITGGAFYNPAVSQFPAEFTGDYFFADFVSDFIWKYDTASDTAQEFATGLTSPVDLQVAANGELYYLQRGINSTSGELRTIRSTNDAPLVEIFGDRTYRENAPAIPIAPTATVTDSDSPNFARGRLTVTLSGGRPADHRLAIRTAGAVSTNGSNVIVGGQIVGTFSGGNAGQPLRVSLTGRATPARVQSLLRNITFRDVSENPAVAARTISVTLSDGDGATSALDSKLITVIAVNDAPQLLPLNGGTVGYQRTAAAVVLLGNATLADPDSANFAGGGLLVRVTAGQQASNRLVLSNAFSLSGNEVRLNGQTIGTVNANAGVGFNRFEVTFNANASRGVVQTLIRSIRFRTIGASDTVQREVQFLVRDGDGGQSGTAIKTVNVT